MGCYYSKIQKRDVHLFEQTHRIEAIPIYEMPEAGAEACIRHEMLRWYPRLEYQQESVTDSNYQTARSRIKIKPHPKTEEPLKFLPLDPSRKVTFADTCLAFVVYGNDVCRGEIEKEENTQDAASPVRQG